MKGINHILYQIAINAQNHGNEIVMCDDTVANGITWKQFNELTGKVYAYLKGKGIGKEDFVMICLPRGIQPLIAQFGIWKNGSAFVLVEDTYAPERIAFIKKDCNCKFVIDADVWKEIEKCSPTEGYEPFDEHAAAFAVYTSGTTGNPKGVVHEFGNTDRMLAGLLQVTPEGEFSKSQWADDNDRFALVAPLNFVASLIVTLAALYIRMRLYVVSYSVIKNPYKIGMYIIKNRITGTFLTPSHIRKLSAKPPFLRFCFVGSEPANNVFMDGLEIHNVYAMSESGFVVTHFIIDKLYEKTPVGTNIFGLDIKLVDENGNEVPDGQEGEICFENPYVRGYNNLPEETAKVFRDGYFYSGDLAYKNEEGELVICGRLNDMVKINGNRVEPGEIEGVAKKVLGVDWTACRIIDNGKQVFVCLYYLDNKIKIDPEKVRKEMSRYLPYYMIPAFFIHIDEIPLRPTGKMDRKALPEPDFSQYQDDYEAPRDDVEKALCKAFESVLEMQRIGINDDFYQLGGDSLGAMDVLVKSKLRGLNASDIFGGRTPAKIAEIYKQTHDPNEMNGESDEEIDEKSRQKEHYLTPYQSYMIDYQFYTPMSTMLNLFTMLRFDKERYDVQKMAQAVMAVVKNHPAFATEFFFDDEGEIVQKYIPFEEDEVCPVTQISQMELDVLKDGLVAPFKIMNSRLFRLYFYETEKAGYIFFDVHHTIFDGTSFKVIMNDIINAYYDQPLEKDYYYLFLAEREKNFLSDRYVADKKYFKEKYDGIDYTTRPTPDKEEKGNKLDHIHTKINVDENALTELEKYYSVGRNAFFALVSMISVAIYNKKTDVMISWTYNGRDDLKKMNSAGLFLYDLPLALHFSKSVTVESMLKNIQEQIAGGIQHSSYPYTLLGSNCAEDDMLCFLYQEDIRDGGFGSEDIGIQMVDVRQNKAASENIMDVQVLDGNNGLELLIDYTSSRYYQRNVKHYGNIFNSVANALIIHGNNEKATFGAVLKTALKQLHLGTWFIRWIKK